VVQI